MIKTQEGTAEYPNPKNTVKDYVKRDSEATTVKTTTPAHQMLNDEVPF